MKAEVINLTPDYKKNVMIETIVLSIEGNLKNINSILTSSGYIKKPFRYNDKSKSRLVHRFSEWEEIRVVLRG